MVILTFTQSFLRQVGSFCNGMAVWLYGGLVYDFDDKIKVIRRIFAGC